MAHELDRNTKTGEAAMFSVLATPWHKLGHVLLQAPTFDEAMHLAGVDYEVALRPLLYTPKGATLPMPTRRGFAVVRTDREGMSEVAVEDGPVLSIVGDRYEPVQNVDAFGVLRPLLDEGVATLETGGTLRGGQDAWMLVQFNGVMRDDAVREVFGTEVLPYGLITTNHSGSRRVLLMETPVRVVCANTLSAATSSMRAETSVRVAHRGGARVKVVEAAQELFAGVCRRYVGVAERFKVLHETRLTVEEFTRSVLDTLAPVPGPDEFESPRGRAVAMERVTAKRRALLDMWTHGAGHAGDHSAWEAYNGAVEVLDHDETLFPARDRIANLIGAGFRRKAEVMGALLEVARTK